MMRKVYVVSVLLLILVGCADTQNDESNSSTQTTPYQPVRNNNQEESPIGERGGYTQSEHEWLNDWDTNEKTLDKYTTEESKKISQFLSERKDVKQAQVAITDDRVVVAVALNEYLEHHEISKDIEEDVKQFVEDKTIVVYTDDYYWKRMRNLNSRQSKLGQEMDEFLHNFFQKEE